MIITEEKLKKAIKKSVKEIVSIELMKLRALIIPYVSDEEQKEINTKYKKSPHQYGKSFNVKA